MAFMTDKLPASGDNLKRYAGADLSMSAGLLKSVPLAEILTALSTHELALERSGSNPGDNNIFSTAHRAGNGADFQVATNRAELLTSVHLEHEEAGI